MTTLVKLLQKQNAQSPILVTGFPSYSAGITRTESAKDPIPVTAYAVPSLIKAYSNPTLSTSGSSVGLPLDEPDELLEEELLDPLEEELLAPLEDELLAPLEEELLEELDDSLNEIDELFDDFPERFGTSGKSQETSPNIENVKHQQNNADKKNFFTM